MPEVSQYYKQQKLASLSGVGNLTAADISAATQGNRELARAGEMATEFGLQFIQQKEKAEYHDQLNTAKTGYLSKFFEYEQGLQANADTETYLPGLEAGQTSSYKFTNSRAANEFDLWKANEDLSQKKRVFGAKHTQDVQNYTQNWNLGIKEATRRTSTAMQESDYQLELANGMSFFGLEYATEEKDGKSVPVLDENGEPVIQLIEDWENPLLDTDEVRMAGYEEWKSDADAKRGEVLIAASTGTAFDVWQSTVTLDDPDGDLNQALDFIEDDPNVPESEKQEAETELKSRIQSRRAEGKLQAEQNMSKIEEDVRGSLRSGDIDKAEFDINSAPIPNSEKDRLDAIVTNYKKSINDSKNDIATSDPTNIAIDKIKARLRNDKDYTYEMGLSDYAKLAKDVKASEGAKNLDDIRTAADAVSDPVLSRPSMVRAQRSLQNILSAKVAGLKSQLQGQELLSAIQKAEAGTQRIQNELDQWGREYGETQDFDHKLELKTQQLLQPVIEEVTLGWFKANFGFRPDRLLVDAKMDRLQEDSIFDTLNDDEKETARKFFEQGGTVQEFVEFPNGQ